jgi:hypothetical protein
MDKNEAFEVILSVISQFRGTIAECNLVQDAAEEISKAISYVATKEVQKDLAEYEDLEKPKKK